MSSSWGSSWGTSWGASWGSDGPVIEIASMRLSVSVGRLGLNLAATSADLEIANTSIAFDIEAS